MSADDQLPQRPLDGAPAPLVAENADADADTLAIKRSPLADPKFGLAWSNSSASDEVLVRAAIKHGAFHLLLEAALHHGLPFVEQQLELMMADEDAALTDGAEAEVRRKLANIKRGIAMGVAAGIAAAERADAMEQLLAQLREMQADSRHQDAPAFDAESWLAKWVQEPSHALGGRTPSEVLAEPDGLRVVTLVLGAQRSGSYL